MNMYMIIIENVQNNLTKSRNNFGNFQILITALSMILTILVQSSAFLSVRM